MKNYPLLDPRRDIVFKTIFTKDCEESHIARNNLISAFLGRTITRYVVLNNELPISDIRDKASRLDIHCVFDNGDVLKAPFKFVASIVARLAEPRVRLT